MFVIWSVSTLIPFFNYGPTNFLCFITLYAVVFLMKNHDTKLFGDRNKCRLIIYGGYAIAAGLIIGLDYVGIKMGVASEYSCYFIRGNYRLLPMVISIAIFSLGKEWKVQNRFINYVASLTFGIYLIHMYPLMMSYLFEDETAIFNMSSVIDKAYLPLWAIGGIVCCFVGCACLEAIRKVVDMKLIKVGIRR